jgi:hypothetical protein
LIHILFIIIITVLYYHIAGINTVIDYALSTEQLLIITAYVFCAKPANILINQFEAVGFLIAAKSILRFRKDSVYKTEYVLIGTLLSFGIAVAFGILPGLIGG